MFTKAKQLLFMGAAAIVTYINLITNGNFTSTTGWSKSAGMTHSAADNTLTFTGSAVNDYVMQNKTTIAGHKYYVCANIKAGSTSVVLRFSTDVAHSGDGTYDLLSQIVTVAGSSQMFMFVDKRSSGWTSNYAQGAGMLDLTATFGAGGEPDKAWCDANIAPNFVY